MANKTLHFFKHKPYWIRLWCTYYPKNRKKTSWHIHTGWSIGWVECEFSI